MCPCKAQARETATETGEDIASPLPLDGDIPDCEAGGADDVHAAAEDDGLPSGAFEDTVARPGV